jgi:uncharacterized protein (TIGR02246 family)
MSADTDAIVRDIEHAYSDAYSAGDSEQLGALFAEEAMVQTEWGPVLDGRETVMSGLVALFAASSTPDALTNTPVLSRQITDNVIVSHGTALRRPQDGAEEHFLYTRVYVRRDGRWLLAANQIARPSEHHEPAGIGDA